FLQSENPELSHAASILLSLYRACQQKRCNHRSPPPGYAASYSSPCLRQFHLSHLPATAGSSWAKWMAPFPNHQNSIENPPCPCRYHPACVQPISPASPQCIA